MRILDLPVNIKYTNRSKSIALKIAASEIIILAPKHISQKFITDFLHKKEDWLKIKLGQRKKINNDEISYLGQKVKKGSLAKNDFLLKEFYKMEAHRIILPRAKKLIENTKLTPNKISFRNTTSQWGSCSQNRNLSFSIWLIKAPLEVIDYVIIHELCHLKEMNHSRKFWNLVEKFCPKYKTHISWLKQSQLDS